MGAASQTTPKQMAEIPPEETDKGASPTGAFEGFENVPYEVDIRVGQAVQSIGQILDLEVGDQIVLDRLAHESVVLTIEDRPLALAEVMLSDRSATLHITEVGMKE